MDQLLSLAALIVCAVVLLSLYNRRFPGGPRAPRLSMEEARQALDGGAAVTVVDVRTQEEFDGGHIPGAASPVRQEVTVRPSSGTQYSMVSGVSQWMPEVEYKVPLKDSLTTWGV